MKRPERILIIEDNEQNLELVTFLLEEAGLSFRAARNAEEARIAVREELPDLILLDIHLPGCDGLSLIGEFREAMGNLHVPIVALTAHAMRGDKERFMEAGCDGYLAKPINVATFVSEVDTYLSQSKEKQS